MRCATRKNAAKLRSPRVRFLGWMGLVVVAVGLAACGGEARKAAKYDISGLTEFHKAARKGEVELVSKFLAEGVSADLKDEDGNTALIRAARDGRMEIAQVLLDHHADTNLATTTGWTPLQLAIQHKHPDMVQLLLRYNADPNKPDPNGNPPLHNAVLKNSEDIVASLLTEWQGWEMQERKRPDDTVEYVMVNTELRKADINAKDANGDTALQVALGKKNYPMVMTLLGYGPDLEIADARGDRAIHIAAATAPAYIVKALLDRGCAVNQKNGAGKTPYMLAYERGDPQVAELVYNRGGR